jgi:hypothetical protein
LAAKSAPRSVVAHRLHSSSWLARHIANDGSSPESLATSEKLTTMACYPELEAFRDPARPLDKVLSSFGWTDLCGGRFEQA